MANFESNEQVSLGSTIVSQKAGIDGAALLFGDRPMPRTATGGNLRPPEASAHSFIASTVVPDKIASDLEEPHISDNTKTANKVFEPIARLGASAFWLHKDSVARGAAIENLIANNPLVSRSNFLQYDLARENLMNGLKIPIAQSEAALEGIYSKYPQDIIHSKAFPKINGTGMISVPHEVDLVHLTPGDRKIAERFTNLTSIREGLIHNWPPAASSTNVLPRDIGTRAFIHAENLTEVATKFDQAGVTYADEMAKTLENNKNLRLSKGSQIFKGGATLGAAWLTNAAIDATFNPKVGPSYLTWAADIVSPAVILTNKSMLVKFGVVTGSHVAAKIYDQVNDK